MIQTSNMPKSYMNVIKRSNVKEPVSFDKILRRIEVLCTQLNLTRINAFEVTKDTINGLYDGITTEDIDHYAATNCSDKIRDDPQYDKLATALCVSRLHKMTDSDFMIVTQKLYDNELITVDHYNFVKENIEALQIVLDYSKDYDFDYFGLKTLEKSYLQKVKVDSIHRIIERPQHMFMRIAIALNMNSVADLQETYKYLSDRCFIFGSPTLYNSGSKYPQLSSCFLLKMEDNLESILDVVKECGLISKRAGGIGIGVSDIRASGSRIVGTNGQSTGIVPMIQVLNWLGRYINQGGKRNGAIAIYIEPWHADVFAFCELRSNKGNEEERARDIFLGLWIPDLFMKRVEEEGMWSLMCPNECPGLTNVYGDEFEKLYIKYEDEKKYRKQIPAKDLWFHILSQQIETGMPYMLYKDHINKQSNQKNLGVIKSSNLCVSGETYILTDKGQLIIKDVVDQEVNVWNGEEWSKVTVRKTGVDTKLIKVKLSNGVEIKCTPEHRFYIVGGARHQKKIMTQADQLKLNDNLIKYDLPTVKLAVSENDMKYAYTHGFFCGDGTTYDNYSKTEKYPKVFLYGEKKLLLPHIENTSYTENVEEDRYNVTLHKDMKEKFFVPLNQSLNVTLRWLEGYCDADGTIAKNGTNESLQITSIEKDFLLKIKLTLQVIGIDSKVTKNKDARKVLMPDHKGGKKEYDCKEIFRLLISSNELYKLSKLGFAPKRLKFDERIPQRDASQFIKVVGIDKIDVHEDTYCFTEPKRNMGMFNGLLTGQCAEIVEYTDETEIATCTLSSICLPRFVEDNDGELSFNYEKLKYVAGIVTRNLNSVIDTNLYPVEKAKSANLKHRPIGVGIQGLSDVYCMLGLPYDSDEARIINRKIFETIYYGALCMSNELAIKYGHYETFHHNGGCPFSKGLLQWHLWDLDESDLLMGFDWNTLIESIKKYGTRNSLLTTVMPTASTSQIMGNTESYEANASNVGNRTTLAGEFTVINKHLVETLIELGLWNKNVQNELLYDKGSVQNIECIPQYVKDIYKTAFELQNKPILIQSIERGPFIDQTQSFNMFCKVPDFDKLSSAHFFGWKGRLKTGMYYLKTQPAVDPINFGLDVEVINKIEKRRNIINNKKNNVEPVINNRIFKACDECAG